MSLFAGASGAGVSNYSGTTLYLVGPVSTVAAQSYQMMTGTGTTGTPRSDTRPAAGASCTATSCGYLPFFPNVTAGALTQNTTVQATPTLANPCRGWVVNGAGGVRFPTGNWQFAFDVKLGTAGLLPSQAAGSASLVFGMWKVDDTGAPVGSALIDPTSASSDNGVDMYPFVGSTHVFSSPAFNLAGFSLASNEHLCVEIWRHQTAPPSLGGNSANTFSTVANDTANLLTHPQADLPSATLASTPADNSYVNASQTPVTLGATYTDPEAQAGTVVLQLCSDATCSGSPQQSSPASVANGASVTWQPTISSDGGWWWRASAADAYGNTVWSATRKFTLDTSAPNTPSLVTPSAGTTTNSIDLTATFSDPSGADTGSVGFRLCSDASCGTVVASGSSSSGIASGSNGTWTINPAPSSDGTYYWEAQNTDAAGNKSSWTSARAVTFDRTAPTLTITSKPPAASTSSSATFGFSSDDPSAAVQCNLDSAGWGTACTSTSSQSYAGLADGNHSFQVRGTDTIGNVGSPASWAWTIDTTVPATPTLTAPADAALTNTIPQLGGTFTDPTAGDAGTVQFRICTSAAAAGAQCSPLTTSGTSASVPTGSTATWTPPSLSDGTYNWQARAQDAAGNLSGWSATRTFTYDSTPPETSITSQPASASNVTNASFSFASTESPSTYKCNLDGAGFSTCTSPAAYAGLAEGSHTFQVEATDAAANTDPSPASYTWKVDTTPPDTTIGPTVPPNPSVSSSATFDLGASEPATYSCKLDGGSWNACATPKTYTGLAEGSHTLQAQATDTAGNVDATPASYTWFVDLTVPSTSLVSPADGFASNTLPQLKATFTDPTSSDTGTVEFRICSASAGAGSPCASAVQDVTSGSLANGATATYTPGALADGQYYWQARAQDAAGNVSAWTATRMFMYDTGIPSVPALASPADGAWVRWTTLSAPYSEPSFAGTGWVEFRVCPDALCLAVTRDGNSVSVVNGTLATWSDQISDGTYWWQARAHDAAGNVSAWSSARSFHLDSTPPPAPVNFNGQVAGDGLTLRWDAPPSDAIADYAIYVNGQKVLTVGGQTYEVKMGAFDAGDTRTFGVRALDLAENEGTMSTVLVGVPNLVGLTLSQAEVATKARGLVLHRDASIQHAGTGLIVAQDPLPATLEAKGAAVKVVTQAEHGNAGVVISVSPTRVSCAPRSVLNLHIDLSRASAVRARFVNAKGRVLATRELGILHAGGNNVRITLPKLLPRGTRIVLDAPGTKARAVVAVSSARRGCSARG